MKRAEIGEMFSEETIKKWARGFVPKLKRTTTRDDRDRLILSVERKEDERRITLASVQIREYARTVGDNPSCSSGPPVR